MSTDEPSPPAESSDSTAERFSAFTRRNILLVAVFFLSNLLTAVSTLITAVTVLNETRRDWRAAEYRKLSELRAGYTLEKFREQLGVPAFRVPVAAGSSYVRNVYRPRSEYWVEVISNRSNASVAFTVTTCEPTFRPKFSFSDKTVVLNQSTLLDVLPPAEQPGDLLRIHSGHTRSSYDSVFEVYGGSGGTNYRQFAWGLNDICPTWRGPKARYDANAAWGKWEYEHNREDQSSGHTYYNGEELDGSARSIMANSVVNTYAETALFEELDDYYDQQIGVDRLSVR
ncbi:ETEC_3214 domain-containing protein [Streptomyces sp. NPDC001663]|uniref:ETEC_3214 domain-containing protein n=1 Tax=Streptomyces sp. NPDC001663 TaxID=3364597 RepID=UPI00368C6EB8